MINIASHTDLCFRVKIHLRRDENFPLSTLGLENGISYTFDMITPQPFSYKLQVCKYTEKFKGSTQVWEIGKLCHIFAKYLNAIFTEKKMYILH